MHKEIAHKEQKIIFMLLLAAYTGVMLRWYTLSPRRSLSLGSALQSGMTRVRFHPFLIVSKGAAWLKSRMYQ